MLLLLLWTLVLSHSTAIGAQFSGKTPKWSVEDSSQNALLNYQSDIWQLFEVTKARQHQGPYWLINEIEVHSVRDNSKTTEVIFSVLGSFEFYWDGHLIFKNGKVADHLNEEIPGAREGKFILPQHLVTEGKHNMVMRFSSEHWMQRHHLYEHRNQLIKYIVFSEYGAENEANNRSRMIRIASISINLLVSIYFLILFFGDPVRKSMLFFSLLCCCIATTGFTDILDWLTGYPYHWDYNIWLVQALSIIMTSFLLPTVFLFQFNSRHKCRWYSVLLVLVICSLWLADYSVLGVWIIASSMSLSILLCLVALKKKPLYASLALSGLVLCVLISLLDTHYFFASFSLLSVMMLISLVAQHYKERQTLSAAKFQASQLEFELLRKSIQPHFLMNSLTSIMECIHKAPDVACKSIVMLADEFRLFNKMATQQLVELSEEIELCEKHLNVMGFRYQLEMRLETEIETNCKVPPAMFHSLVENAISHNQYSAEPVIFRLQQKRFPKEYIYEFLAPVNKLTPATESALGLGMGSRYIKARLEQSYPKSWNLKEFHNEEYRITRITVPVEMSP